MRETREEYRNGVFCKLISEPFDKTDQLWTGNPSRSRTPHDEMKMKGHREKWVQKSCVSFEEEYISYLGCRSTARHTHLWKVIYTLYEVYVNYIHLSLTNEKRGIWGQQVQTGINLCHCSHLFCLFICYFSVTFFLFFRLCESRLHFCHLSLIKTCCHFTVMNKQTFAIKLIYILPYLPHTSTCIFIKHSWWNLLLCLL